MKRSYLGVILLSAILLMDIIFTQLLVHQYFYQNYTATLIFMGCNILLFPIALFIYNKEKNQGGQSGYEK